MSASFPLNRSFTYAARREIKSQLDVLEKAVLTKDP